LASCLPSAGHQPQFYARSACASCRVEPLRRTVLDLVDGSEDREEVISAGEAYYMEPGDIPVVEEDAVIVEFSPLGEYQKTMAALEG
jgi:hypothetical protein